MKIKRLDQNDENGTELKPNISHSQLHLQRIYRMIVIFTEILLECSIRFRFYAQKLQIYTHMPLLLEPSRLDCKKSPLFAKILFIHKFILFYSKKSIRRFQDGHRFSPYQGVAWRSIDCSIAI